MTGSVMGIILAILRITGLVLLIVLGLLLFLAALFLLVPVRYRMEASFDEAGEKIAGPHGRIRLTWFGWLLHVTFSFGTERKLCLRVLGIRIFPGRSAKAGPERTRGKEGSEKQGGLPRKPVTEQETNPEEKKESVPEEITLQDVEESATEQSSEEAAGEHTVERHSEASAEENVMKQFSGESTEGMDRKKTGRKETDRKETDRKKVSLIDRLRYACRRMAAWFLELSENTEAALDGLTEKIRRIRNTCSWYLELAGGEDVRHLTRKGMKIIKRLVGHVKPRRIRAEMEIGTGDPASTGNIFAVLGMLYPVLDRRAHFIPDFERKRLVGYIWIKGRIRAGVLLFHGLRMVVDRRLWRLIRQLKKGGNI